MVTSVTNLGRSGLYDWVIQRFSAIILAAYTLCIMGSLVFQPELDYAAWRALFGHTAMRIFSLITLFSLCAHAWIGMWTISTDYLTTRHAGKYGTIIRLFFQFGCALLTLIYLLWGIEIFWSS